MSGGDWKKPLYAVVKQDSRNAKWLGNAIGGRVGDYIENEADRNIKNPGRAVGKAAAFAASWYAGGALGGAGGAAGAAEQGAQMTAQELAKTATEEAIAQQMAAAASQGAEQGLLSAAPGAGVAAPNMHWAAKADTALINSGHSNLAGGKLTGALKTGFNSPAGRYATSEALKGMQPQQQPMSPPMRYNVRPEPMPMPYGDQTGMPYGSVPLTEEEKRLRALGLLA